VHHALPGEIHSGDAVNLVTWDNVFLKTDDVCLKIMDREE